MNNKFRILLYQLNLLEHETHFQGCELIKIEIDKNQGFIIFILINQNYR